MAEEKNLLQSIKLDISKNVKLTPYERLAFHKILGILKSESAVKILSRELDRGPLVRESALSVIRNFQYPAILPSVIAQLEADISFNEKLYVLEFAARNASVENFDAIKAFIEKEKNNPESDDIVAAAYSTLASIAPRSDLLRDYLISEINSQSRNNNAASLAIVSLAPFQMISFYEELLNRDDDLLSYSVYKGIAKMCSLLLEKEKKQKGGEESIFTFTVSEEDDIFLDIKVLLGKKTQKYDSYSSRTRAQFIHSLLGCNHREYLIYVMKALTSGDSELMTMTLGAVLSSVTSLRDPDKLFRNLLSITAESDEDNGLIVEIFGKYFSMNRESRQFNILRDKMYGNITVTLDAYFENYRKQFLIREVIEKSYPENFQKIRQLILEKLDPAIKRKLIAFLINEHSSSLAESLNFMGERIYYINEKDGEKLYHLMEVLLDADVRSRENSASRLEDLDFEKLYLKTRIIRLCRIIGRLNIEEAASSLVKIYNYLKKYPDEEILGETISTLANLNYSYMLGEVEILLNSSESADRMKALKYISLFSEQRSLNLLMEFLQNHYAEESREVNYALNLLKEREIKSNVSANQVFKSIIETCRDSELRAAAVLGIGDVSFPDEFDYLNSLFHSENDDRIKEAIIRSMDRIIAGNDKFNKRQAVRYLQEALKDPAIKVRVYSCLLLIRLGALEALKNVMDMLVIKNRAIQRDILTIFGDLKSLEFAFFLLSLIKEEYGITNDIIRHIERLPAEDLREIEAMVINLFRKFEAPQVDEIMQKSESRLISIPSLKTQEATILNIEIPGPETEAAKSMSELIAFNAAIKTSISALIRRHNGRLAVYANERIVSYFDNAADASGCSLEVADFIGDYNETRIPAFQVRASIHLISGKVRILHDELIDYGAYKISSVKNPYYFNRVICDKQTAAHIRENFRIKIISEQVYRNPVFSLRYREILYKNNYRQKCEELLSRISGEKEKRRQQEQDVERESKKLRYNRASKSSVQIAGQLDDIGEKVKRNLDEIENYVQKRSTDRELIRNVHKMLNNTYNLYKVEISRIIID